MPPAKRPDDELSLPDVAAQLDREQLLGVLLAAARRHEDVDRSIRLAAAPLEADLTALRAAVDRGLRTRRFLDYRSGLDWAHEARPLIEELEGVATVAPSAELVELVQRAIGHVVKVMLHADDSSGLIGSLVVELLGVHAQVCDAGVADPVRLARWIVRFRFRDQDFFEADPVRYAQALGKPGLRVLRKALADTDDPDRFAAQYLTERLAIIDRDVEVLVALLGGDQTRPHQFQRVAEAMLELDEPEAALAWATRGIHETDGWQVARLYDLAAEVHRRDDRPAEALALRRHHHERAPSTGTYSSLRAAAQTCDVWEIERDAARSAIARIDTRGYVSVLLDDNDDALAWTTAQAAAADQVDRELWLRLADRRAAEHPADALAVLLDTVDTILVETDRRAYTRAVKLLKRAREVADAAGQSDAFAATIARLRETHRRRPTLIALLDKARLLAE